MSKCTFCGTELPEGASFCPSCGKQTARTISGEPFQGDSFVKTGEQTASPADFPMKWHNFLMVVMIIGAVLIIINGLTAMSGLQYDLQGASASHLYSYYPGLRAVDILYGIALIGTGGFQIVVRNRLHAFRREGPRMMTILYAVSIAYLVVYGLTASAVTGISIWGDLWGSIVGNIVMMIINYNYYEKRKALFVN